MSGPLPKAQRQRERDTKRRDGEFTTVTRGVVSDNAPSIEEATGRADWSDDTRRWWSAWEHAPQADLFEVTDWQRLALLAVMVEGYFRRPSAAALSEIRMNEQQLGATWGDRLRARIRVEDAKDAEVRALRPVPARESLAARMRDAAEEQE